MKNFVRLCVCLLGAAAFASDVSIVGTWDVATSVGGTDGAAVCTFTQKESALTGSCTGDDGDHPLTGTVDGNKVNWSYKMQYEGQELTINFSGILDSDKKFGGKVDVQPMGVDGEFSAKRK